MICAPIDTDGPRFYVSTIEGYPISACCSHGRTSLLVATVIDSFYGSAHGRFASNEPAGRKAPLRPSDPGYGLSCACGRPKKRRSRTCAACRPTTNPYMGRDAALTLAAERCAELNAWHEREGWDG